MANPTIGSNPENQQRDMANKAGKAGQEQRAGQEFDPAVESEDPSDMSNAEKVIKDIDDDGDSKKSNA